MAAELYFTGKPCKRGHIAYRFKSTGTCVECNRENVKRINSQPEQIAKRKAREKPLLTRQKTGVAGMHGTRKQPSRMCADSKPFA